MYESYCHDSRLLASQNTLLRVTSDPKLTHILENTKNTEANNVITEWKLN